MRDHDQAAPTRLRAAEDPELLYSQVMAYARDLRLALERSRRVTADLARTHLETVAALAAAVDIRDRVTGGHVHRVATFGALLAEELAPELRDDPQLVYGFLLHDIGKLAVPDAVLRKAGPLTAEEQAVMRSHVEHGIRFVRDVGFLRPALDVIATHHEHVDGSGYPQGLVGEEIPLAARMFIVCDAFDAMIHDRPYRRAMSPEHALAELHRHVGTQFDPDVIAAVERRLPDWLAVEEHPPIPSPSARSADARARHGAPPSRHVFHALDQPMVVVGPDGVVLDANLAFTTLFGLRQSPVGVRLEELADREGGPLADRQAARQQWAQLRRDLLDGRREGGLAATGGRWLTWSSNVVRDDAGTVAGRVVVLAVHAAPLPHAAERDVAALPDLRELQELLDAPDPEDPVWRARAARVREGLARMEPLVTRLERDTVELLDSGERPGRVLGTGDAPA